MIERVAVELADADGPRVSALTRADLRTTAPELFETRLDTQDDALTLRERSRSYRADEIRTALASLNGDRDPVCKALGISKTKLRRK